jgi:hypothetical protein
MRRQVKQRRSLAGIDKRCKVTADIVKDMRARYNPKAGVTARSLADEHNLAYNTVYQIITRRTWKYV